MNAKKAKGFRMIVRQMVAKGVIPGEPYADYGTNKNTGSVMLNPMSPKGMYRRLKREGLQGVFAPQATAA